MGHFPCKCRYVAGWSDERGEGMLVHRIAGRQTAFCRKQDGSVASFAIAPGT